MGLSFLMNIAFLLSGRDRDKGGQHDIEMHAEDRAPHEVLLSDDEADHSPATSSRPLRQFDTFGSTLRASRTLTSSTSVKYRQTVLSRARTFFFPKSRPGETAQYAPYYRYSPIISGVVIPFSILLEIPGLTEHWYIRTEANKTIETRPNSPLLDAGLALSMSCAVFANICLILRFSEKRVKATTLFCVLFLTMHDTINIATVTAFGVIHRVDDGFTYGQAFWMTLCSTIASTVTNLSLISDFVRTKDFAHSGSGLTRKQRSLVILVIILLMYIALGAWINSVLLHLDYINGLYFTVVSIETIGFGDIVPRSTGARVWVCVYNVFGVVTVGIVISLCRETVLEGLEIGYRKRLRMLRVRRREARRFRKWQTRWRRAIEWRLRRQRSAVWVSDAQWREEQGVRFVGLGGAADSGLWLMRFIPRLWSPPSDDSPAQRPTKHVVGHPLGKHLNINALSDEQLHEAALEAGVPLEMFVDFSPAHKLAHEVSGQPNLTSAALTGGGWPTDASTPTDAQIGRMSSMLTKMALALSAREIYVPSPSLEHRGEIMNIVEDQDAQHDAVHDAQRQMQQGGAHDKYIAAPMWLRHYASGALAAQPYEKLKKEKAKDERNANLMKLAIAWTVFFAFWFVGAAIFSTTERWTYGVAIYFCFICFLTTGYGDYAPVTPAGRSVFVVWALFGVATMTILVAVVEDACSAKYQSAMHSQVFDHAVRKYRRHTFDATEGPRAEYQLERAAADHTRNADAIRKGKLPVEPDARSVVSIQAQLEEAQDRARKELEALPHEILRQARTFHHYMHFFAKGGGHGEEEHDAANVPRALRQLLDEVVASEDVDERGKQEILADDDSKHTLFILSIERALKKMIHSADSALQACAERDTIMAVQKKVPGDNLKQEDEGPGIGAGYSELDSSNPDDHGEGSSSDLRSSSTPSGSHHRSLSNDRSPPSSPLDPNAARTVRAADYAHSAS